MIFAPLLSGCAGASREQVLVMLDALSYCACAVAAVYLAPEDDARSAAGSLGIYLAVSLTAAWWRHYRYVRAPLAARLGPDLARGHCRCSMPRVS